MGLPALMNAVLEVVATEIADCLGWDDDTAESLRMLRYHGSRAWPPDCCGGEDAGTLVVKWESVEHGDVIGTSSRRNPGTKAGWPVAILVVRYTRCWPAVKATDQGEELQDDLWDEHSAVLADVADCVAHRLVCLGSGTNADDAAVLAESACQGFDFQRALPTGPEPGCAGVEWRSLVTMVRRANVS